MAQRTSQSRVLLNQPGQPRANWCVAEYDFAIEGGAISQITLRGDTLPSGAQVDQATILIETVPTSGGAPTISVDSEGAADINAAAAISGLPWSTLGPKIADKLDGAGEGYRTTADRAIKMTIATATLTAGKFKVLVRYWML